LGQLKNNLKRRGYKQNIIKKSFNKANNISRSSLLQYKEKQKCKRTPCVLTYPSLSEKQLQHHSWALNNICTLAINSAKYFVLFSGDLTGIR
jgi:hypothetical protein